MIRLDDALVFYLGFFGLLLMVAFSIVLINGFHSIKDMVIVFVSMLLLYGVCGFFVYVDDVEKPKTYRVKRRR